MIYIYIYRLCNNYVRGHGHKCTDDGPWGPYPSDDPDTD